MLHEEHAVRRVLTSAYKRMVHADFSQSVELFVFQGGRWATEWGTNNCGFVWLGEVDHAMQQLDDYDLGNMDSGQLRSDLVTARLGNNISCKPGHYILEFTGAEVATSLAKIIGMLSPDVSSDSRVQNAMLSLSPLEQKFLIVLAMAGDGERVSNDELAQQCWEVAVDNETIRNVYRAIQKKLVNNRELRIANARNGYKLTFLN